MSRTSRRMVCGVTSNMAARASIVLETSLWRWLSSSCCLLLTFMGRGISFPQKLVAPWPGLLGGGQCKAYIRAPVQKFIQQTIGNFHGNIFDLFCSIPKEMLFLIFYER